MADKGKSKGGIVTEMVLGSGDAKRPKSGDLVVEPDSSPEADNFSSELEKTLRETEQAVLSVAEADERQGQSWQKARSIVEEFKPVPWFIWRLSNFVLGTSGQINKASEGLVFGLRRLLFAAASDPVLGAGTKINSVHKALDILQPDVLAAVAVIHAICRRLSTRQFERIWRPILDDALLRAQVGFYVGSESPAFGSGRGMLAGFAGRCGLAMLISSGDLDQARRALELLATGEEIKSVGLKLYGCDPLQVSAMTISAAGCGRDGAFGTVAFSTSGKTFDASLSTSQASWHAAFTITECVRVGNIEGIDEGLWQTLNFCEQEQKDSLLAKAKISLRRGHGWNWIPGSS